MTNLTKRAQELLVLAGLRLRAAATIEGYGGIERLNSINNKYRSATEAQNLIPLLERLVELEEEGR